ncbi:MULTISPECIES: HNH endonuclease [Bacillus]|uniref:HNH endonuclease n=1 Tax=Bacillus TaxID=1386 RepID=UPI00059DB1CB|nr:MULTISPECIES: hypothetical protein [Bacillus]KIN26822.1 hypothetical protein B4068_4096 [Bacillus subtilis]KIN55769.1 hypothetical protein B4073_4214 [Bacillus subtilis]KKB91063.1 hypothetical protein WB24_19740 [Bacillus sp. CMAA 1185]MBC9027126.1 hypothetical protein [Bacillus subtilis]MCH4864051.1 hypothetical protein [Bacillus sp. 1006-3]
MARRTKYSTVKKQNQIRADHVKGMGDVPFLGFQCLNPECTNFITIRKDEYEQKHEVTCNDCGFIMYEGGESVFYDYELVLTQDGEESLIEDGQFIVHHDEYIEEALEYKYCIVCNALKPLTAFGHHKPRKTGRQGECRICKNKYNQIKNQTRTTDQHRESAQKRRLYTDLAGHSKLDSEKVYERFNHHCFKCNEDLSGVESIEKNIDHTLPVYYLYSLSTENATLLCRTCNGEKSGSWPNEFYTDKELRKLSVLTGIPYDLMAGEPQYNKTALEKLKDAKVVDSILYRYSKYIDELIKLRNRIKKDTGIDFFDFSSGISETWIKAANQQYEQKYQR